MEILKARRVCIHCFSTKSHNWHAWQDGKMIPAILRDPFSKKMGTCEYPE